MRHGAFRRARRLFFATNGRQLSEGSVASCRRVVPLPLILFARGLHSCDAQRPALNMQLARRKRRAKRARTSATADAAVVDSRIRRARVKTEEIRDEQV